MAWSSNGFAPVSEEYLTVGEFYKVKIQKAEVRQIVEMGEIKEKLFFTLAVSGVRAPVPNSIKFGSRPSTNEKNAQTNWDKKWTRFKEVFGIALNDENFASWVGKVGELTVGSYKGQPFFELPKKMANAEDASCNNPSGVQNAVNTFGGEVVGAPDTATPENFNF